MKRSEELTPDVLNDCRVLADFIRIYCKSKHHVNEKARRRLPGIAGRSLPEINPELCDGCAGLLMHAVSKRIICPHKPKPACKRCERHCYTPEYRLMIRRVMKFSGMHLIKHGRLDLIYKFFS
jgi:hypothetical protein